jgi:hypothetical protein
LPKGEEQERWNALREIRHHSGCRDSDMSSVL